MKNYEVDLSKPYLVYVHPHGSGAFIGEWCSRERVEQIIKDNVTARRIAVYNAESEERWEWET